MSSGMCAELELPITIQFIGGWTGIDLESNHRRLASKSTGNFYLPPAIHPDDQTPELLEAMLAELRAYDQDITNGKMHPVAALAFNLCGFFLTRNWVGYQRFVVEEIRRRMPDIDIEDAQRAVEDAREHWSDVYYP